MFPMNNFKHAKFVHSHLVLNPGESHHLLTLIHRANVGILEKAAVSEPQSLDPSLVPVEPRRWTILRIQVTQICSSQRSENASLNVQAAVGLRMPKRSLPHSNSLQLRQTRLNCRRLFVMWHESVE